MPNGTRPFGRPPRTATAGSGIIPLSALWALFRMRNNAHWSGHPSRLDRATLNESYRFGDISYAKEELRAELASVFLAAERGIPHDPEQHATYVSSWISVLKQDKNEIFRAAHDASRAADFLLALERDRVPLLGSAMSTSGGYRGARPAEFSAQGRISTRAKLPHTKVMERVDSHGARRAGTIRVSTDGFRNGLSGSSCD
jgi:hypothetical protein